MQLKKKQAPNRSKFISAFLGNWRCIRQMHTASLARDVRVARGLAAVTSRGDTLRALAAGRCVPRGACRDTNTAGSSVNQACRPRAHGPAYRVRMKKH